MPPSLTPPAPELVKRLLNEVDFNQRIMGFRLRERTGPLSITIYSFVEALALLYDEHPRIDFDQLATWVSTVIQDAELGQLLQAAAARDESQQAKTERFRVLMTARLVQCKQPTGGQAA